MRLNTHHIKYEPEWTVELQDWAHRYISIVQRLSATEENYALLTNHLHSLVHEWNRIREELDAGGEK